MLFTHLLNPRVMNARCENVTWLDRARHEDESHSRNGYEPHPLRSMSTTDQRASERQTNSFPRD